MIMAELALLTENKKELVDHLNDLLIDPLLQELQCIYDETRKILSIHESNSKLLKILMSNPVLTSNAANCCSPKIL